jgi:hypothetical protein
MVNIGYGYHLVMTNSLPWKIPTINGGLYAGKIIYFYGIKWAIYTMAILVITRGYIINMFSCVFPKR